MTIYQEYKRFRKWNCLPVNEGVSINGDNMLCIP